MQEGVALDFYSRLNVLSRVKSSRLLCTLGLRCMTTVLKNTSEMKHIPIIVRKSHSFKEEKKSSMFYESVQTSDLANKKTKFLGQNY